MQFLRKLFQKSQKPNDQIYESLLRSELQESQKSSVLEREIERLQKINTELQEKLMSFCGTAFEDYKKIQMEEIRTRAETETKKIEAEIKKIEAQRPGIPEAWVIDEVLNKLPDSPEKNDIHEQFYRMAGNRKPFS